MYIGVILLLFKPELTLQFPEMFINNLFKLPTSHLSSLYIFQLLDHFHYHLTHLKLPQIPSDPVSIDVAIVLDVPVEDGVLLDQVLIF